MRHLCALSYLISQQSHKVGICMPVSHMKKHITDEWKYKLSASRSCVFLTETSVLIHTPFSSFSWTPWGKHTPATLAARQEHVTHVGHLGLGQQKAPWDSPGALPWLWQLWQPCAKVVRLDIWVTLGTEDTSENPLNPQQAFVSEKKTVACLATGASSIHVTSGLLILVCLIHFCRLRKWLVRIGAMSWSIRPCNNQKCFLLAGHDGSHV